MTNEQKLKAYEETLEMLEATAKTMTFYEETGSLSEHGKGSLWRLLDTIKWLKGENEE
jgi:hypothetical protein